MDNNEQQKIVQFNRSIYMFCFWTKYKQDIIEIMGETG